MLREAEGATLLHASSGFGTGSDVWVAHWEDVAAGQTVRLRIYMTCVTSREHAQPMAQAVRMRRWAFSHEHEELTTAHQRSWDQVWRGRVRVCGDDEAQAALDGSLYHLASSASAHSRGGMAPFGLSSDAYKGHVFWDCDLWTYPPFVLLDPAAARAILGYRLRGVPAARAYASMYGCEGLMFPWEAAGDGQESTVVRAMTGIQQHHITPDVAFAFWQYQIANGDDDWMREATWPVLKGVASWIVSRVESSSRGYEIRHVIAPDEFSQNVHNNAFTNLACRRVLQFAMDCAARVGQTPPRIWKRVAEGLVIPRNENGWILQQDGWTGERKAKQADTLLAVYPFDALERPEDIANVLAQHVPQNPDHRYTVAMGDQIHAVVAARMGRRDDAALFFRRAWEPYWIQPWGMYAETAERRSGCFVTGHGGLLQAALTGFTGLQLEDPALAVHDTALPAHWTRIECDRIWWRGEAYHLSAEHGRKASLTPIDC